MASRAPNPHDRFVRSWLSIPTEAAAFFRMFLPEAVRRSLDLRTIKVVPGTFIEPRLRESITDILFEAVVAGRKALIYLLLEHQSTVEWWMPLRMDLYIRKFWETWRERHPEERTLPPVIPIVLYHGDRPWSGPRSLSELVEIPEEIQSDLASFLPVRSFVLVDLSATPDAALRTVAVHGTARAALSLFLLKHGRAPGFRRKLSAWRDLFHAVLAAPNGWSAFRRLVSYIFMIRDDLPPSELSRDLGRIAGPEAGEFAMTIAERLKKEGRVQGRAEGRAEGRKEGLKEGRQEGREEASRDKLRRLLEARFGPLGPEVRARLAAADLSRLDAWFDRAVTAGALASVFDARE